MQEAFLSKKHSHSILFIAFISLLSIFFSYSNHTSRNTTTLRKEIFSSSQKKTQSWKESLTTISSTKKWIAACSLFTLATAALYYFVKNQHGDHLPTAPKKAPPKQQTAPSDPAKKEKNIAQELFIAGLKEENHRFKHPKRPSHSKAPLLDRDTTATQSVLPISPKKTLYSSTEMSQRLRRETGDPGMPSPPRRAPKKRYHSSSSPAIEADTKIALSSQEEPLARSKKARPSSSRRSCFPKKRPPFYPCYDL